LFARESGTLPVPDLDPQTDPGTLHLLFFQSAAACYCLFREGERSGWERRELGRERLLELVDGLREAALDGWYGSALAALAASGLRRVLLGVHNPVAVEGKRLLVTGAYPFSIIPWSLVLPEHAPVFRPALSGGPVAGEPPVAAGLLALTEDGTTLPMAVREHALLGELFPESRRLVAGATDAATTRTAVLEALPGCRIFHFAGHGYQDNRPERSGLVLSGRPPCITQDAILDAPSISRLDLRSVALVFLNSCSSGFGRAFAGGLESHPAAAFLRAGVRALIVSLVPVPDNASAAFMESFYRRLVAQPGADPGAVFHAAAAALSRPCPYLFVAH
jgi:hypothetical protein